MRCTVPFAGSFSDGSLAKLRWKYSDLFDVWRQYVLTSGLLSIRFLLSAYLLLRDPSEPGVLLVEQYGALPVSVLPIDQPKTFECNGCTTMSRDELTRSSR